MGQGPAGAWVLTAGLSFQATAAGPGPWGSGAERGAPAAPVLHVAAQGWQGPHHRGLCAGRDLPGQPPAGAEGRGGESFPCGGCQQQVPMAVPGGISAPWPGLVALAGQESPGVAPGRAWRPHFSPVLRAPRAPPDPLPPSPKARDTSTNRALVPVLASCCRAQHGTAWRPARCCCAEQPHGRYSPDPPRSPQGPPQSPQPQCQAG